MKARQLFIIICFIHLGWSSNSQTGVGIIIGEPTGISIKQFINTHNAWDGAVAWSGTKGRLQLHTDYLYHRPSTINIEEGRLPYYFGLGAYMQLGHASKFGARIPVGLEYFFDRSPLGIFLEIVPKLELIPDTVFDMDAALGIRFYF